MKSKYFFQYFERLQYKKQFNQCEKIITFIFALPFLFFIDAIFYPSSVWQRFCIAYERAKIKELTERLKNEEKANNG